MQSCFSAPQTAWRREMDSNSRYRSETRKRRHLRKLHGINQFRNSPVTGRPPVDTLNNAVWRPFRRRMAGDSVAESRLYDASQAAKLVRM